MSKLGKKLNIIILGSVIVMLFILLSSLLVLIYKNSTALIENQLTADVEVFKASVNSHIDRSAKIAEYWSSVGMDADALENGDFSIIEKAWATQAETENDFCAILDTNGNVAWKTPNFDLVSYDAQNIISSGNSVRGLFKGENVPLSARYMGPVSKDGSNIGAIIVGFDLSEVEYLEELKEQTDAQVTIFAGKTRYATTVTNDDGTRAVGTDMAENVEETVILNGITYKGTAEILGERHYVLYEPIYDYNNDVIGAYFAGYSAEDVYAMLRGVIFTAVICAVITVLILSFVIMVIVRRFIEKPLHAVEKIASEMREGRFSVPDSRFNFANDEMGSFARKIPQRQINFHSRAFKK